MDRKQEHKGCLFYPTVTPSSPNSCPLGSYTVHIPRVAGPSHQRPRPGSLRGPGLLVSECAVAAHGALALAAPTSCWACGPWWHAVQQMMTQPSTQQAECISSAGPGLQQVPRVLWALLSRAGFLFWYGAVPAPWASLEATEYTGLALAQMPCCPTLGSLCSCAASCLTYQDPQQPRTHKAQPLLRQLQARWRGLTDTAPQGFLLSSLGWQGGTTRRWGALQE